VEDVSWQDCEKFLSLMNSRISSAVKAQSFSRSGAFVLPHEDEWEYACRGGKGNSHAFYFGSQLNGTQANMNGLMPYGTKTAGPTLGRTCEAGSYAKSFPHPWGLCDMHGNVWEFCTSRLPRPLNSDGRVIRGGCYMEPGAGCRSAHRHFPAPQTVRYMNIGFRACFRPD